jgi:hypothetical protein
VPIPEELPSTSEAPPKDPTGVEGHRGRLIFPVAIYSLGHYDGWQQCLRDYLDDSVKREDEWIAPMIPVDEPFSQQAMRGGYSDCRLRIRELKSRMDADQIARLAREAYRPRIHDTTTSDLFKDAGTSPELPWTTPEEIHPFE